MTLRVVQLGLGKSGMGYDVELDPKAFITTYVRAFSLQPSFELVVVDPDKEKRTIFSEVFGPPSFDDPKEAL
jgi:hypothetical protein